jgi:hypothetical protein
MNNRSWIVVAAALVAACKPATPPRVPTALLLSQTSVQLDAVGANAAITATVNDQDGKPMTNVAIVWTSSAPTVATVTGTTSASITALSNGVGMITATAGNAQANVAVNVAQVPVAPTKIAGDAQAGTVGAALSVQLRLRVADRLGAPIVGQTVSFTPSPGSGSVSPALTSSSADGTVSTAWTLGTAAGSQTVNVSVGGAQGGAQGGASFTAIAAAGPAALMAAIAGNNQSSVAGSPVTTAPAVRVTDSFNNPVSGIAVTFAILSGGGSITGASATTNGSGIATLGGWTLGPVTGTKTLSVTAPGLPAVTFTATGVAGPPVNMLISGGNNQAATIGTSVPAPPSVRLVDANANGVPGVNVVFAVASGGGSATVTSVVTNSTGIAGVGSWILGSALGTNTMTATAEPAGIANNPRTFTATGTAAPTSGGFNIELRYLTTATTAQQTAFAAAVARWQAIIMGDISQVSLTAAAGSCGANTPAINEVIDDLLIFVSFSAIDGVGGTLASAGPCFIRTATGLTAVGTMSFDVADAANMEANGSLTTVILHEMGHVLGIGTLWTLPPLFNLLQNPSLPSSPGVDTRFSGSNGIAGFDAIGGATYSGGLKVPVENTQGGAGTRDGHWRESVLQNELMTGFINAGSNPLSLLSVRSLQDLGYLVNTATADAFFLTLTANARAETGPLIELRDDIRRLPIYVVDEQGVLQRIVRPPPF